MADSDCSGGSRCRLLHCVGTVECGGGWSGMSFPRPRITGECAPGCAKCAGVCEPGGVDGGPPPVLDAGPRADAGDGRTVSTYGCRCDVAAGDAAVLPLALLAGAIGLALSRRPRR